MKAVIVAAGKSSRMYPLTLKTPKPLLKIDDLTIIEHSINNLTENGVKDIAVVVGYLKQQIIKKLKGKVTFIYNPFYEITNDMASLWFAKEYVRGDDFLYLHGDLVYHSDLIKKCFDTKGNIILVVDIKRCDEEDMKVRVKNGLFVQSSKEISVNEAYGEWIGIAKFSKKGGILLFNEMDKLLEEKQFNVYDTLAFTRLAKQGHKTNICLTDGLPWVEIDFVEEFERVKKMFNKCCL